MTGAISAATRHYRAMFARRSAAELHELAHIKRFMERLVGDQSFRDALAQNIDEPQRVTERYGIDVDPRQMLPLWRGNYLHYRFKPEGEQWPLARTWDAYMREMLQHRDMLRDEGDMAQANPRFHAWRERQMRRCAAELGGSAASVTHPVIAFELSEGCTVGCWFCGLSADRFKGHYAYTDESAELWRGVVGVAQDLFGPAVRTGFCYWATDPCDNPDYDRFLHDYYRITGALPQTTTAAPLKDLGLTRRVLALFDKYRTVTNRFSVLTRRQLDQIHATFSAEELMGVELVMQSKESLTAKAEAGRARDRREKLRAANMDDAISLLQRDHTTIACVSGFLVSMPLRRVQLVTPVPGSERWPLGYRIVAERSFASVEDFREALAAIIEEHMQPGLPAQRPIRFRRDLAYSQDNGRFRLHCNNMDYDIRDDVARRPIGELIAAGSHTASSLVAEAAGNGMEIMAVADLLDQLHEAGVLEEDLDDRFAGQRNEGLDMRMKRAASRGESHAVPA